MYISNNFQYKQLSFINLSLDCIIDFYQYLLLKKVLSTVDKINVNIINE